MSSCTAERKARMEKLAALFPEDERLRNGVMMTVGSCQQIPMMSSTLLKQLEDLPAPGSDTVQWESMTQLALADVLRWAVHNELAIHDLRQALFFRYNNRVRKMAPPEKDIEQAIEAQVEEAAIAAASTKPEPEKAKEEEKKQRAVANLGNLFGNLKK
jgi:hypothetical protein